MKKNLFFILALSLVIFACGPKETPETALKYHREIVSIQTDVDDAFVELRVALGFDDEAEISYFQENFNKVLADALKNINDFDKFDGTDEYKKEMIKLLSMYEDLLEYEIPEIIYFTLNYADLTEEEVKAYFSTTNIMSDKYDKAVQEFTKYQDAFAEKWKLSSITDNEPQVTSKTAEDYHYVFVYIQSDIDEAYRYLMDIIESGDEAEIYSAYENAETVLADAFERLEDIDKFDGSDEYKKAMFNLLSMYKDIFENEIKVIVEYTINFEDYTDKEWEYYSLMDESMKAKYDNAYEKFAEYQDAFAGNWKFSLG